MGTYKGSQCSTLRGELVRQLAPGLTCVVDECGITGLNVWVLRDQAVNFCVDQWALRLWGSDMHNQAGCVHRFETVVDSLIQYGFMCLPSRF